MMRRLLSVLLLLPLVCGAASQQPTQQSQPAQQPPPPAPANPNQKFMLQDGTPIRLRTGRTVSSADAHVGDQVDFEVLDEVRVGETLVIPKGGIAWATVTEAQRKRRMGRAGKLNMNIDAVRLVSGDKVALRAVKEAHGGSNAGKMTGAIVATSILFFPAAPLFLFVSGKDVTIPKGTEITAYINGDTPLDIAKFQEGTAAIQTDAGVNAKPAEGTAPAPLIAKADLDVVSTPGGAEILLDGNFVGNTPSSIGVSPGEHTITIKKNGFKLWERKITISTGRIKVAAELEAEIKPPGS